jgi:coatomer subunit beta
MEKFPDLRSSIIERLLQSFLDMKVVGRVYRGALWIIGEYSLEISCKICYIKIYVKFNIFD